MAPRGSAHETETRTGFAHLFEHMLSAETEHLGRGQIREIVSAAGGSRNATTNTDRTNYFEMLPSDRVNLSRWLHAERMARLVVDEANFSRERQVVKEERRLRVENQYLRKAYPHIVVKQELGNPPLAFELKEIRPQG